MFLIEEISMTFFSTVLINFLKLLLICIFNIIYIYIYIYLFIYLFFFFFSFCCFCFCFLILIFNKCKIFIYKHFIKYFSVKYLLSMKMSIKEKKII